MKFLLTTIAVCICLAVAGSVLADEVKIKQRFTGVGHPTMVDTNGDGVFASASTFELVGNPGRATIQALGELGPVAPGEVPCDLQAEFVQESFVETFNDGSMLFFDTTTGFSCVSIVPFEISGELSGIITGGIGRFEWAAGTWTIEFEAIPVGQTQTAFIGTLTGTVEIPD